MDFPGWIPREQLYDLYARATAFLYPSLFEGFGLPVLEALAAGVPTGCSRVEPMDSLAGDAALKFDPRDPSAIAEVMHRLVTDDELRRRLAAAGPRRAAEFSWRSTAKGVLEALGTPAPGFSPPSNGSDGLRRAVVVLRSHTKCIVYSQFSQPQAAVASQAGAQQYQRQARMVGGGSADRGKCTIEVVVDGTAEVEIRGDQGSIRNLAGRPAEWRRFECNAPSTAQPVRLPLCRSRWPWTAGFDS